MDRQPYLSTVCEGRALRRYRKIGSFLINAVNISRSLSWPSSNKVSLTGVPSAHQASTEPFHESLLLVLVKRGLTVAIDYGYFGFGSERSDEGGNEVEVFFRPLN